MSSYDVFSEFYDSLMANVGYDELWSYYKDILSQFGINDGIILDLACGTGSLSCLMAESGYDVIAVDKSIGMLGSAREKSYRCTNGNKILFLCQDMRELDLFGTVKATLCTLDSLNHLDSSSDVERVIERVSLFTEPGGVFAFDLNTLYKHREVLADRVFVYETDDVYCVWQNELSEDRCTVNIDLDFFVHEDGAYDRFSESFCETAYDLDEISSLLSKHDFEVVGVYAENTLRDVRNDDQRAVFIALKK